MAEHGLSGPIVGHVSPDERYESLLHARSGLAHVPNFNAGVCGDVGFNRTREDDGDIDIRFQYDAYVQSFSGNGLKVDDDVVAHSATVPSDLMIKDGRLRHFYKEAMTGVLPDKIIAKPKHGFGLPFVDFAAGYPALRDLACDSIAGLKKRGLFSSRWLDTFLKGSGKEVFDLYGGGFWDLMMLELWFQNHYDAGKPSVVGRSASKPIGVDG